MSCLIIWLVAVGFFSRYKATKPATAGDAAEVPPKIMCRLSCVTTKGKLADSHGSHAADPVVTMFSPVDTISGFTLPSRVGPRLEVFQILSFTPGKVL